MACGLAIIYQLSKVLDVLVSESNAVAPVKRAYVGLDVFHHLRPIMSNILRYLPTVVTGVVPEREGR